jgi:autotransporter-associated beta strand protein
MKRAGDWRIGMRRQVLQSLVGLGRNPQVFQQRVQMLDQLRVRLMDGNGSVPMSMRMPQRAQQFHEWGEPRGGGGGNADFESLIDVISSTVTNESWDEGDFYKLGAGQMSLSGSNVYGGSMVVSNGGVIGGMAGAFGGPGGQQYWDVDGAHAVGGPSMSPDEFADKSKLFESGTRGSYDSDKDVFDASGIDLGLEVAHDRRASSPGFLEMDEKAGELWMESDNLNAYGLANKPLYAVYSTELNSSLTMGDMDGLDFVGGERFLTRAGKEFFAEAKYANRFHYQPNYVAWVNTVFPPLPGPLRDPSQRAADSDKRSKLLDWSDDAIALSKSLLRLGSLWKLDDGIELRRTTDSFDPRWKRTTAHERDLVLYSPKFWLARGLNPGDQTLVNYCDEKERGVYSLALMLGRTRKSCPGDLKTPPLGLGDYSLAPLHDTYRSYKAKVEAAGDNQARLVLTQKGSRVEQRFLIDTARHVLLKIESVDDGKVTSTTTFSDFVEIGRSWWARSIVTVDAKRRTTSETKLEITSLGKDKYDARIKAEIAAKPQAAFLHLPGPALKVAQQHVADGSAGFDDRITMMLYNCLLQQWDEVLKQLDAAEKLAADKPGVRWIRTVVLQTMRRNDETRQRLLDEARKLALGKQPDEMYLAEFIIGQSRGVASAAEQLEFVNLLQPVYDRQPEELRAKTRWQEQLLGCYDSLGRSEEALALRSKLAQESPWNIGRQTDYAQRLLQAGRADDAYAWLQKQLDRDIEYGSSTDDSLRSAYAELYRSQARWEDLLKFTTTWIERKPEYQSAYTQHLSALVYNDKLDDANKLAETWLKDAQIDGTLSAGQRARLDVAVAFSHGSVYGLPWNNQISERWFEPLAEAARFFARQKDNFGLTGQIVNDGRFFGNAAGDRFRGFVLSLLQSDLERLSPEQVSSFIGWSLSGRIELAEPIGGRKQLDASEIPLGVWKAIVDKLHERWKKTEDRDDKNSLSQSLVSIYSTRFSDTELLPFLRERIEAGPKEFKLSYISALFDTLLGRKWSEENEKEVFALLPRLTDSSEPADVLSAQVPALYRLVDAMVAGRQAGADEELHDQGKTDELTRTQLMQKKLEFAKAAKTAVAQRLGKEAESASAPFAPWLRMEKAFLDVQLEQNLPQVEEFCWQLLGEVPAKPKQIDEVAALEMTPETLSATIRTGFFDAMLRGRAFTTVMNLAARRNAQRPTVSRVLKYIDAGIEQGEESASGWRAVKFQMLVALDRPDDLERQLREWVRSHESTSPWRHALAMLLAERGQLDEAVRIFEAIEKDKLLLAPDYRTLSDWYLVTNRREDYEKARIEAFRQLPENIMNNMFWGLRNRWMRTDLPLPSQLDDNTLLAMRALFEKSANPENYFLQLRDLYAACRDFRLLDMLPDAVLGRSPQQVYGFLQGMQSSVLGEVRNEATADEILARVKKLREGKLTNTDQRALDLMEALVERRASEVLNQPKPHVDVCLAAMKRAFERQWSDGEPILMASFLRNLGTLPHQPLIDEQIRELRELQAATKAASRDHLVITDHLCNLLFWSYGRHEAAIEEMTAEVRGYVQAHDGHWPHADNEILGSYVHLLEGATRHAAGEKVLLKYLAHPENDDQRKWLNDRLLALYNSALEMDGEVTLGKGNTLFENLLARGLKELDTSPDENVRHNVVARLVSTFDIARRKNLASAPEALKKFVFETMPVVLKKQQNQYRNTASAPLQVIADTLGPKFALQYIVERMEQFPSRLETTWDNRWQTFGFELARRRAEAAEAKADIAELEPRVLKLTVAEIQRYIRTGQPNNQHIYFINWQYFWSEKAGDFARAAEEVYTQDKQSGRNVMAVANYLWSGLNRYDRAIEILLVAHRDGLLDEGGQNQLAEWLQHQNRHAESIPILEPLVEQHPDSMHYRTMLMVAYHRARRPDQLLALVKSTDAHFHEGGRWTDGNVAEFGKTCGACELHEKAVAYLTEAISLHQRAHGQVVLGDGTLSDWYQHLAGAHSALGHTKEAVDAASGAIVCWSSQQNERRYALDHLKGVLRGAKDLPEYIKQLDAEAEKSGQDSAILRKAIGQVLQERKEFKPAIAQLEIAVQLEPTDKEIRPALIACRDATGDKAGGTRELLKLIELDSHNLPLYQQLAERLTDQPAEAERTVTSIIEAGPQEAENHTALAEIRQKQNRWDEAIDQWAEVAKLRSLEPTGLVKLAEAQIHQSRWDAARQSIEKLQRAEWPSRFGDINNQTRQLQEKLPKPAK